MGKAAYSPLRSDDDGLEDSSIASYQVTLWRRRFLITVTLFASVMLLLSGVAMNRMQYAPHCSSPTAELIVPYSPAPVRYVNKWLMNDPSSSRFSGAPRPELDQAWHEMLDGTMIRLSDEELLEANNATSVRAKSGGYIGALGVSHSLHCLKRIKQYLHPEYYYSDNDTDWDEIHEHVNHCLESLRLQLLCSADLNLWTFKWTEHSRVKPANHIPQQHVCVDWDALHSWMQERAVNWNEVVNPADNS